MDGINEYAVILANGIMLTVQAETLVVDNGIYLYIEGEIVAVIPNNAYVCKVSSHSLINAKPPST